MTTYYDLWRHITHTTLTSTECQHGWADSNAERRPHKLSGRKTSQLTLICRKWAAQFLHTFGTISHAFSPRQCSSLLLLGVSPGRCVCLHGAGNWRFHEEGNKFYTVRPLSVPDSPVFRPAWRCLSCRLTLVHFGRCSLALSDLLCPLSIYLYIQQANQSRSTFTKIIILKSIVSRMIQF